MRYAGIVTIGQQPERAKGTVFIRLEDETGAVQVIVWKSLREKQRAEVLRSQLLAVYRQWQRERGVKNIVLCKLVDLTPLLRSAGDDEPGFPTAKSLSWPELLQLSRVVILSEAGAGKTEEIRRAAWKLRDDGKDAFFLRLELIPDGFEEAFEEGTFSEFQAWLGSNREGWLLLDPIDEARLRAPQDFERAVRAIGRHLQPAAQRVRIILTGRTAAWRPLSDLALCEQHLPFGLSEQAQNTVSGPRDTAARQRRGSSASGDAHQLPFDAKPRTTGPD